MVATWCRGESVALIPNLILKESPQTDYINVRKTAERADSVAEFFPPKRRKNYKEANIGMLTFLPM